MPTVAAALPRTGPSRAPKTAALIMTPISSPRRSSGARAVSHVNAATHESELPKPARKRVKTSIGTDSASPKRRLIAERRVSPTSAAALTPTLEATYPLGALPTSTPAPYAPLRTPTADFERPNSSSKKGTSGVSAA